ncbi:MAG: site-specific DNA-methyltransferase [Candidatus Anammoxibacter sp.]
MVKKQKLELTWVGKDERVKLEPRVLVEEPGKSYGDPNSENMLIFGDNLLSLKALEQDFAGKIKCIYIDPPYNTGNAFEHYDDGLEHSLWLNMIKPRIEILRNLLKDDGSLWISIDDDESHYLKVLCDEVFGRQNFVANVIWEKKYSPQNDSKWLSDSHDHIIVYAKSKETWRPNLLPRTEAMDKRYKNPDNDPRGVWKPADFSVKTYNANSDYTITLPSGRLVNPPESRCWVTSKERFEELTQDNRIWFGKTGNNVPSLKKFLSEVKDGSVSKTIWLRKEVGDNQEAKKETKEFNSDDVFTTPKPERLIHRILTLGSNKNDWVLDSFAGSGTTGAVAHKMGRKWIMCELGKHCHTHIIPRMRKVIDGTDLGGISVSPKSKAAATLCKECNDSLCEECNEKVGVSDKGGKIKWRGGGGFKYYRLAESLLVKDKELSTAKRPVYVINPKYDETLLIKSICKIENFRYRKDGRLHGISSEQRFLHVTTRLLTQAYMESLSEDISKDQSLLIYCTRKSRNLKIADNVEIKKIPKHLLEKCDFEEDKK